MWPRHSTSCPALPALAPLPAIPPADRSPSTFWGAIQWPRRATRVVPAATREAANPTSYADFPAPTTTTRFFYKAEQRGAARVHWTQHGGAALLCRACARHACEQPMGFGWDLRPEPAQRNKALLKTSGGTCASGSFWSVNSLASTTQG